MNIALRSGAVASAAALTLLLSACSASNETTKTSSSSAAPVTTAAAPVAVPLSGSIAGAGSSAQASAMEAWIAGIGATSPALKIAYDPVGSGGGRTFRFETDGGGIGDIFGNLFGGGSGGRRRNRAATGPQRGRDLETELHLQFDDAIRGVTSTVRFRADLWWSCQDAIGRQCAEKPAWEEV